MLDIIENLESEVRGYVRSFPTVFDTASGSTLTDRSGKSYIDFFAGAGTLNYGHNNPRSNGALIEYISRNGIQHALDMATTAKVDFLKTFEEVILKPRNLDYKVQFTGPTGTNSVEAAIKLAKKSKQRSHIVAFTNAYHGHSLGSLTLTGNQYYHDDHYGSHNNVTHLPFDRYLPGVDSAALLSKMLGDPSSGLPKPAAVILETIQCEGGINVATIPWLREISAICQENDVLLIIDDIQVGNGRTGQFFSFEEAGLKPDMVCLSKSIGGGLPMSLVLIKRECDVWQPGQHTGTFRGNNLAFIAARQLLEYWRDDQLVNHIANCRDEIITTLDSIANRYSSHQFRVRGRGMVWGLDVVEGDIATSVSKECFKRGLVIETAGCLDQVVKLLPPLTIETDQLIRGLNILEEAVDAVMQKAGAVHVCLPAVSGNASPVASVQQFST